MKRLLQILFTLILLTLIAGFVIKSNQAVLGNRIIGISILFTAFIFMPLFRTFASNFMIENFPFSIMKGNILLSATNYYSSTSLAALVSQPSFA